MKAWRNKPNAKEERKKAEWEAFMIRMQLKTPTKGATPNKYKPHQGEQEKARRRNRYNWLGEIY